MKIITARAHARAGLLGNPSDGYDGKAIAFIIRNFTATVRLEESDRFEIVPAPADALAFPTYAAAVNQLRLQGCYGGVRLIRAAMKKFSDRFGLMEDLREDFGAGGRFRVSYDSDIPRQVGLSGSSAIVIAMLRALADWFDVKIPPFELSELALAAETEELGIAAGPMDRVIQSYEGLVLMDFKPPRAAEQYRRLDPALLPPLFIAYDPNVGEVSGKIHSDVKFRWLRGDPEVREAISVFPKLVDEGIACLENGDHAGLMRLVNTNFDTRARIWRLSERDHLMVSLGRKLGAAVKFAGSGGAVVGVLLNEAAFPAIQEAYEEAGFRTLRPIIEP